MAAEQAKEQKDRKSPARHEQSFTGKVQLYLPDWDGCLSHCPELVARTLTNKDISAEVDKYQTEEAKKGQGYKKYYQEESKSATKVYMGIGSNRQTRKYDRLNSDRYAGNPEVGRAFYSIPAIAEKWGAEFTGFVMNDVAHKLEDGETIKRDAAIKDSDAKHSKENDNFPFIIDDENKIAILYGNLQRIALMHPKENVTVHFTDDIKSILDQIEPLFSSPEGRQLIPKNVTLQLGHYAPALKENAIRQVQKREPIKGEGIVNHSYKDTLHAMDDRFRKLKKIVQKNSELEFDYFLGKLSPENYSEFILNGGQHFFENIVNDEKQGKHENLTFIKENFGDVLPKLNEMGMSTLHLIGTHKTPGLTDLTSLIGDMDRVDEFIDKAVIFETKVLQFLNDTHPGEQVGNDHLEVTVKQKILGSYGVLIFHNKDLMKVWEDKIEAIITKGFEESINDRSKHKKLSSALNLFSYIQKIREDFEEGENPSKVLLDDIQYYKIEGVDESLISFLRKAQAELEKSEIDTAKRLTLISHLSCLVREILKDNLCSREICFVSVKVLEDSLPIANKALNDSIRGCVNFVTDLLLKKDRERHKEYLEGIAGGIKILKEAEKKDSKIIRSLENLHSILGEIESPTGNDYVLMGHLAFLAKGWSGEHDLGRLSVSFLSQYIDKHPSSLLTDRVQQWLAIYIQREFSLQVSRLAKKVAVSSSTLNDQTRSILNATVENLQAIETVTENETSLIDHLIKFADDNLNDGYGDPEDRLEKAGKFSGFLKCINHPGLQKNIRDVIGIIIRPLLASENSKLLQAINVLQGKQETEDKPSDLAEAKHAEKQPLMVEYQKEERKKQESQIVDVFLQIYQKLAANDFPTEADIEIAQAVTMLAKSASKSHREKEQIHNAIKYLEAANKKAPMNKYLKALIGLAVGLILGGALSGIAIAVASEWVFLAELLELAAETAGAADVILTACSATALVSGGVGFFSGKRNENKYNRAMSYNDRTLEGPREALKAENKKIKEIEHKLENFDKRVSAKGDTEVTASPVTI